MLTNTISVYIMESLGKSILLIRMDSWPPVSPRPSKADGTHLHPCRVLLGGAGLDWLRAAFSNSLFIQQIFMGGPLGKQSAGSPGQVKTPGLFLHLHLPFTSHSSLAVARGGVG